MEIGESCGRRPAYGYLQLHSQQEDEDLGELQSMMRERAEREGLRYVVTFFEYQNGSRSGFGELLKALDKEDARHVIVPTLGHISHHYYMLAMLLDRLDERDAEVLTLNGE